MAKFPKAPGPYWAVLDDGNGNIEPILLHVHFFSGLSSFDDGALCEFIDGSGWGFEVDRFEDGMIVQPSRVSYAASKGAQFRSQVKVTWHGEAKAPASTRKQKAALA